jgi:isochorismate synthase EntC
MWGISPELLFEHHNTRLNTIALAGTMALPLAQQYETNTSSFLNSSSLQKIAHEHQLVVDDICTQMRPFGKIYCHPRELVTLPHLAHWKTSIGVEFSHARPPAQDFEPLIHALHPTAALGAYPRIPGEQWLRTHTKNRGYYGAPFGVCTGREFALCISTIRGMEWQGDQMLVKAGGGVVASSKCNEEWEEIEVKCRSILGAFNV